MATRRKNTAFASYTALMTSALFLCAQLCVMGLQMPRASAQGMEEEEPTKRIAVFVIPASSAEIKAALLMNRVLRENTAKMTNVELVTPAPVMNSSALPELQSMVEKAYQALNSKDVTKATGLLTQAKPLLEQILPVVPLRTVALFYKAYGVSQALAGNVAEARSSIELSLTLWSEQSNLEYAYSVEVLKLFTAVQADLEGRPSSTLAVTTTPENAVVIVDTREPMQSPARVTNLMTGAHLVKVVLDGHDQWAGFVGVKPGQDNVVELQLKAIPEKATFDQRLVAVAGQLKGTREDASTALLGLKQFLGADELLVLECSVIGENYELSGFHVKTDDTVFPAKRTLARDASFLAGVREFLSGLFESFYELTRKTEGLGGPPIDPVLLQKAGITSQQSATVFDPDNPVFPTVNLGKKKKDGITTKWWFWTTVGVVVAGGAGLGIWLAKDQAAGGGGPSGTIEINLTPIN
jgi:hypothetical protein